MPLVGAGTGEKVSPILNRPFRIRCTFFGALLSKTSAPGMGTLPPNKPLVSTFTFGESKGPVKENPTGLMPRFDFAWRIFVSALW